MNLKRSLVGYAIFASLSFAFTSVQGDVLNQSSDTALITKREIPEKYHRAYEYLEFMKDSKGSDEAFDPSKAPHWDIAKYLSFISKSGVTFTDVNGGINGHFRINDIQKALKNRNGPIFNALAHLAHIYSIPYEQYSELGFDSSPDGVVVHVSDWYALTFKDENGLLQLTRCDYQELEGE